MYGFFILAVGKTC